MSRSLCPSINPPEPPFCSACDRGEVPNGVTCPECGEIGPYESSGIYFEESMQEFANLTIDQLHEAVSELAQQAANYSLPSDVRCQAARLADEARAEIAIRRANHAAA